MSISEKPGKLAAIAGLLLLAAATIPAAHAEWESLYPARADDRNCDEPQDTGQALYRNRQNRELRVEPGSSAELEAYGHLLDLVDVRLSGITDGSAIRTGGNSGTVNNARYCGAIGSVKFRLSVGANARIGDTGTLILGGDRISVKVVDTPFATDWSVYNISEALSPETQAQVEARRARQRADVAASAPQRAQDCAAAIPQCEASQNTARAIREAEQAACAASGQSCGGFIVLRSCREILSVCQAPTLSRPDLRQEGPARCLRDLGGNITIDTNGVLVIEVPADARSNTAAFNACIRKGLPITITRNPPAADITPFTGYAFGSGPVRDTRYRANRSTGPYPMTAGLTSDTLLATLPARLFSEAVGTITGELMIGRNTLDSRSDHFRDALSSLKWRVEISPGNGMASLSTQLLTTRKPGELNVSFALKKAVTPPKTSPFSSKTTSKTPSGFKLNSAAPVLWDIVANGTKPAAACFAQTNGTANVASGQTSGSFDLKPTEASGCSTSRFTLRVRVNGATPGSGEPFGKELSFAPGSPIRLVQPKSPSLPKPVKTFR